jgi:hypothetical protein
MAKTPEYTRRAVDNYRKSKDFIQIQLPAGTKAEFESLINRKAAGYISEMVLQKLEELKNESEDKDTGPDQPEPVAVPEPEKPVKKQSMSLAELQKLVDEKRSENDARKERIEKAKEARKEFDREETYRQDPDRKTDIQDASKAPEIEEEKPDKAFCKADAEIQALLEEAKQIEDMEGRK